MIAQFLSCGDFAEVDFLLKNYTLVAVNLLNPILFFAGRIINQFFFDYLYLLNTVESTESNKSTTNQNFKY
ncbi:hypothetical protein FACHB389_14740 [Nostoc calcicola FACHB-389]|nr:hypothetical protein FACHB389_14740 [Nostoc calcicola FACHB-389]